MNDCIFCKIVSGQQKAEFLFEDDKLVVFKDIFPKAPVHLLVVPKKHINSLKDLSVEDSELMAHIMLQLPQLAQGQGLAGFRTIINTGKEGGQEVFHLHVHLVGGSPKLPGFV
jgi:histidine triad (HIT) family protein